MIITHKTKTDLTRRGVTPRVDAVQDDRYSRNLELSLFDNEKAWAVPAGCTAAVSYVKPDGTVGKYDTLPDGTSAWSVSGNVLTVALAPQLLTVAGPVNLHVHLYSGEAVLSTFAILVNVQPNPAIHADSEDYINMSVYLPQPQTAKVGQYLEVEAVDTQGKITAVKAVDAPTGGSIGTETDPTVPSWAKQPQKPAYTASEVGADPTGTAASQVSSHNSSTSAHGDIRVLLGGLENRLNALADSDDTTLDQLSEIVAYIKSNKALIDTVTTGKVSVTDIVDNLTTNAANKPLSAAQGVALKTLIDAITVPTKVSQLENDAGYLKTAPVVSVNGKTGAVSLSAADVGALPASTKIPSKTSDLVNDSGFLTDQDISGKVDAVPAAVKAEASRVVDTVLTREGARILRFLAVSDAHQKNDHAQITAGNKELGQAIGQVLGHIGVDFVANLGDITWGSSTAEVSTVLEEGKTLNGFITDSIRGETQLWTEGNHETGKLSASQIHALIYSHNRNLVQDTDHWIEGYGYLDFPNQKVRVICLNTNQGPEDVICGISNEQLKWFAETALNMEGRSDWSVMTMGHHPLSYNTVSLMRYSASVIEAFLSGSALELTTNDGFTLAVDYSNKSCQYIGHFHGHAHAFSVVKMQKYVSSGVYAELDAWEICIPNACYERNNQYLNNGAYTARYSTPETYTKEDTDGKRTSFNVVTVCLDEKMIYADNYGAGIDRSLYYGGEEKVTYSVTNTLTNVTSSNSAASVIENTAYTATLTADSGYELSSVIITMGGVDVTDTVYSSGAINIAAVTGDIVITATATASVVVPSYTNQIPISTDTDGSIYNGVGYKENTYLASGVPGDRSGVDCSGFIPMGYGSSASASGEQVVRMSGMTITKETTTRIAFYNSDKSFITQIYGTHLDANNYNVTVPNETDGDGNVTLMDLTALTGHFKTIGMGTPAYIRINCTNIDGSSILTVNEEIT